jgi:FixJ family two-component response regulator
MKLSEVTVQIHRRIVMHTLGAKSLPDLVRLVDALGVAPRSGAMT